ncbi:MAG: hypothetical protein Q9224_007685, partial [Gallowayella concinna]
DETCEALAACVSGIENRGESVQQLVDVTSIVCLLRAANAGKLNAVKLLLQLGFKERINETLNGWTAFEMAYDVAIRARSGYIESASKRWVHVNEAEGQQILYHTNTDGHPGTPSWRRYKERYWSLPAVLKLLEAEGGCRTYKDILNTPTILDAYHSASYGFTRESQPNREHWQILYDLEGPIPASWEEDTLTRLKDIYTDEQGWMRPSCTLLDRWPQLISVLIPSADGWFGASLRDQSRVE